MCAGLLLLSACNQSFDGGEPMKTTESNNTGLFNMKLLDHNEYPQEIASASSFEQVILDDNKIYVSLGGSSSCPPVITNTKLNETELIISLKEYPQDTMCTADYRKQIYIGEYDQSKNFVETASVELGQERHEIEVTLFKNLNSVKF